MVDAVSLLKKIKAQKKELRADSSAKPQTSPSLIPGPSSALIDRSLTFSLPCDAEVRVMLKEDPSGALAVGTGATLWDCSIALTEYLLDTFSISPLPHRVLELGAGCGLPSIALSQIGWECVASERGLTLAHLDANILLNSRSSTGSVRSMEIDWMACDLRALSEMGFSMVIGADLVFPANREVWEAVAEIYKAILASTDGAVGYLAYEPRRPEMEAKFFDILLLRGIERRRVFNKSSVNDIHLYELTYRPC